MKAYAKTIWRFMFLSVLIFSMLIFAACQEKQKRQEVPDNLLHTDISPSTEQNDPVDKAPTDIVNREYTEGEKYLQKIDDQELMNWLQKNLEKSKQKMYAKYDGEQVQRIVSEEYDGYSLATCSDVVFYRAEQDQQPGDVVKEMIKVMILPLMEPSETRPYTITAYKIEEQRLIPHKDGIWIIPLLDVYYCYEGVDFVSWETHMKYNSERQKDGLLPLVRQGSEAVFVFVLMEEDGIYRLQRAEDMIAGVNE